MFVCYFIEPPDAPPPQTPRDFPDKDIPKFNVIKSTTFMEDNGKGISYIINYHKLSTGPLA